MQGNIIASGFIYVLLFLTLFLQVKSVKSKKNYFCFMANPIFAYKEERVTSARLTQLSSLKRKPRAKTFPFAYFPTLC